VQSHRPLLTTITLIIQTVSAVTQTSADYNYVNYTNGQRSHTDLCSEYRHALRYNADKLKKDKIGKQCSTHCGADIYVDFVIKP
jgi:hypothetical protein